MKKILTTIIASFFLASPLVSYFNAPENPSEQAYEELTETQKAGFRTSLDEYPVREWPSHRIAEFLKIANLLSGKQYKNTASLTPNSLYITTPTDKALALQIFNAVYALPKNRIDPELIEWAYNGKADLEDQLR